VKQEHPGASCSGVGQGRKEKHRLLVIKVCMWEGGGAKKGKDEP